jgi:hypothetical protein
MDQSAIEKLNRQVCRQFPELSGVRPSVRNQSKSAKTKGEKRYLLTYKGSAALPGGRKMKRIVRVVSDQHGHILRISTSK